MSAYVLIVMINTMYVSSIDFHDFSSQSTCEAAAKVVQLKNKDAETICQPK